MKSFTKLSVSVLALSTMTRAGVTVDEVKIYFDQAITNYKNDLEKCDHWGNSEERKIECHKKLKKSHRRMCNMMLDAQKKECNLTLDKPEDSMKYSDCKSQATTSARECVNLLYKKKEESALTLLVASTFTLTLGLII